MLTTPYRYEIVEDRAGKWWQPSQCGEDHSGQIKPHGNPVILSDHLQSLLSESHGLGNERQITVVEYDICMLYGHIGAGVPHGEADVRVREGGGVIDTISHHGNHVIGIEFLALHDPGRLVFR